MSLSRREAIVGTVAAAVAPKLPLPVVEPYVNPWAQFAHYDLSYAALLRCYQLHAEKAEATDEPVVVELQK